MRHLPRPNEEIFDTGVTWTPEKMPQALDAAFTEIEAYIGSGGTGGTIASFTGNGRLVITEADAADSDQFLPPSPALAFTLPEGFAWIEDGALYETEEDIVLTGLPVAFEGYLTLHAERDDETDAIEWTFTPASTRAALGTGTAFYFETDAEGVTLLDATDAKSDVILSLPLLQARQRAQAADIETLSGGTVPGGGGGGGGGGSTDLSGVYMALAAQSERNNQQDLRIAELETALNGDNPQTMRTEGENEILRGEMQRIAASQTHDNPALAQETSMAIVIPGRAGAGETLPDGTDGKVHYNGGNWRRVPRKRGFS
jgi:hypothetical protein